MTILKSLVVTVLAVVVFGSPTAAQSPVGALAIDERQGDQWGWAVDHETAAAAQGMALQECGPGCSVVLTFGRCAAYAADQDADSTAVGWAESYDSAAGARQAALAECRSRGSGTGCIVRVWGCNGPVVEEDLDLNPATRRQIQLGLRSAGFDPGGADGLFGPRTREAIRNWQSSRGTRSTGYLDGPQVEALRSRGAPQSPASAEAVAADAGGVEVVFWQSVQNSTNPADFEAYLRRFPNGVFSELAQNRLAALGAAAPGADPASRVRPDETCAGRAAGVACWMELSQKPGCYVWNPNPQPGETVTWTGACAGGKAQGTGTLTWAHDAGAQTSNGRLVDGEYNGHWVLRDEEGTVSEGYFVDGEENGHWVVRFASGQVQEGPYLDGEPNGNWIIRFASGEVQEGPIVDGEQNGHWVVRFADGDTMEGPYVNGVKHGRWIWRSADGDDVVENLFEEGEEREMNILKLGGEDVR